MMSPSIEIYYSWSWNVLYGFPLQSLYSVLSMKELNINESSYETDEIKLTFE